jgi:hypothetical protein
VPNLLAKGTRNFFTAASNTFKSLKAQLGKNKSSDIEPAKQASAKHN